MLKLCFRVFFYLHWEFKDQLQQVVKELKDTSAGWSTHLLTLLSENLRSDLNSLWGEEIITITTTVVLLVFEQGTYCFRLWPLTSLIKEVQTAKIQVQGTHSLFCKLLKPCSVFPKSWNNLEHRNSWLPPTTFHINTTRRSRKKKRFLLHWQPDWPWKI